MIQTIFVTNPSGEELELGLRDSEADHELLVFNLEGLGPPKATVSGVGGPGYDGIRASFVRTDARHIILTLAVTATGASEETAKNKIYQFFPIKGEIQFRVDTDFKDAYVNAIVEDVQMNQFAKVENAVISLYCPHPYWLDNNFVTKLFYSNESGSPPFYNDPIQYYGEAPVGLTMSIVLGAVSDTYLIITNEDPNGIRPTQTMTIDLTKITPTPGLGWRIYIDTRVNQKSIVLYSGDRLTTYNIFNAVDLDSDWIRLEHGTNQVEVDYNGTPSTVAPDDAVDEYFKLNDLGEGLIGIHTNRVLVDIGTPFVLGSGVYSLFDVEGFVTGVGSFYGTAIEFDYTKQHYLTNGISDSYFNPTGDFAFSIWFYQRSQRAGASIITANRHASYGWELRDGTSGNLQFGIKELGTMSWHNIGVPVSSQWNHLVCWYDASLQTSWSSLNNQTPVSTFDVGILGSYASSLSIGGYNGESVWYHGKLSAFQYLNRVPTSDERTYLYGAVNDYGRTYAEMMGIAEILLTYRPEYEGV